MYLMEEYCPVVITCHYGIKNYYFLSVKDNIVIIILICYNDLSLNFRWLTGYYMLALICTGKTLKPSIAVNNLILTQHCGDCDDISTRCLLQ